MKMRVAIWIAGLLLVGVLRAQDSPVQHIFRIKYVAEGAVYIDGGRNAGLTDKEVLKVPATGMSEDASRAEQLAAEGIATIRVLSVADSSAVCEIISSTRDLVAGDAALRVSATSAAAPVVKERPPFMQVVEFTTDDPLEEEKRAAVPRPPLPEINRARGRIGVEYNTLIGHAPSPIQSSTVGLVLRANMTRIGGTYWNFNGYWRGRLSLNKNSQAQTVSDLLNRTYQLGATYSNPDSSYVAGAGRLYLPWASSLDILDGGYLGVRSAKGTVTGMFAGTTPDPTSWDYTPNRKLTGAFFAIDRGSYEDVHVLSAAGIAVSAIGWRAERQFAFTENTISYHRKISVFESMQIDAPHSFTAANPATPTVLVTTHYGGINRSYVTLRLQPHQRVAFDLNHSYFRGVPTFDPVLIGTGLLDRYLFQGFSGGVRAEAIRNVILSASVGRSSRSGDTQASWNRLYGVTLVKLPHTDFRVDMRYSQFTSVFGQGEYESLSISRQVAENLRVELQGGVQTLHSTLAINSQSHFVTSSADWSPGRHLFLQSFYTWQRGGSANFDQFSFVMGSRF
jgi:hypothetical protein